MGSTRRVFLIGSMSAVTLPIVGLSQAFADAQEGPSGSRIAYVIGNWKYDKLSCGGRSCRLRSPAFDSRDVSSFFQSKGFSVRNYSNLGSRQLLSVLAEFSRRAAVSTVSVFYYSGHAIQYDDENFLVPVDVEDIENAIKAGDKSKPQLISAEWVTDADSGPETIGVVVLDACRDNLLTKFISSSQDTFIKRDEVKGLAPVSAKERFLVSYATAANHTANDGQGPGLSPFTKAFLNAASKEAISIQETFDLTVTSVCDLTQAATPDGLPQSPQRCQRPALYTSLGAEKIYWDEAISDQSPSAEHMLINMKMGLAEDPAIIEKLGRIGDQFSFNYLIRPAVAGRTEAQIVPDLRYFESAIERGRSFVMAAQDGYYAPNEGSTCWSLSYPILDIIGRRLSREPQHVADITIETDQSRHDMAPYLELFTPGTGVCDLTLVNQSWNLITRAKLEFDGLGTRDLDEDDILAYIDGRRGRSDFECVAEFTNVDRFQNINLASTIIKIFPDVEFYLFRSGKDIAIDKNGSLNIRDSESGKNVNSIPVGFESWYVRNREIIESDSSVGFTIAGQMTSWNSHGDNQVVDFAATLTLVPPGVGAGTMKYSLAQKIHLPIDGKYHKFVRPINISLTSKSSVVRIAFALVADRSSFHRLRVTLNGKHGPLFKSDWMSTHIIVSRNDKEAI